MSRSLSRSLLFLFSLVLMLDGSVQAEWFGKRAFGARLNRVSPDSRHAPSKVAPVPNRYRTPYPTTTTGGISIGVFSYPDYNYPRPGSFDPYRFDSYVYDPYRFGSFEAPDLLNDPYFRERHRYDSHFPGRRPAPLKLQTAPPEFAYPSPRNPYLYQGDRESLRYRTPTSRSYSGSAIAAPRQLAEFLAAREDGPAWIEFLAPDRVEMMIRSGDAAGLAELLSHYEGIVNNPALDSIVTAPGFQETRQMLIEHVQPSTDSVVPEVDEETSELLPPLEI